MADLYTVRSRKLTAVVELVEENVMFGWKWLKASMKLFNVSRPWVHIRKISSMYLL